MSDQWDFYLANVNDKFASIVVDLGIHNLVPDTDRPWLLWVWVYMRHAREDGMSNADETKILRQIEDSLGETIGDAVEGTLVGRMMTDGHRAFYYYAPTFTGFDEAVVRGMARFPQYRWDSGTQHDPVWNQYLSVLYPSPHDRQRIMNRRVIEQLAKGGDPLTKKRPVFHWAYFPEQSSRDRFVEAIQPRGYEVTKLGDELPLSVSFERIDHVDWDSINHVTLELFDLAESLSGDYDGWETSIERDGHISPA